MTDNPVLKIIEKAFGDNSLRQKLLSDMPETLKKLGVNLSPEQMQELLRALDESGEAFASGLDQRLSQSGVSLNPHSLLQQSKKKAGQKKDTLDLSAVRNSFGDAEVVKGKKAPEARVREDHQDIPEGDVSYDQDEPDYEVERD
ncbi:MAG: hypothetical protein A2509_01835 [Candidatus Edwardsbacteria bacterium RIFOXYD12_FULL_50_11]|jgi:hypothetical protein|uniref:Uncharacterized protein n=1 Tax=Candidatus Edwardsbacteria bacterium GWF2_54_11 TaxID=1817851 RepID=A0A1F5RCN7_9BACT|nr:MAG: hypothetical protein A2502_03160 [Candidatus Edwardsbacteria bacterium RifOxyC12_full_54_24]OGF07714.1 MAG: hypothetical protein A2273_04410 [Candidatus Edwardsbacteria bacterium RifOxyA12_full_54_48]OGF09965.1 MAG: hypothetical protein A3K15_10820 [Candidatus Edwardsbacteria bacterium GWE2_54_12]OGF12226.1 MAG: hypothetical protein A2024_04375 [Candidatus Edwardsbacteria bacterium GWF2_54_11]OGF16326.1 MAG: hypothetical protein A2509_01835 [Candidatus Edwardsbacteria bacterium RIFOXYD1